MSRKSLVSVIMVLVAGLGLTTSVFAIDLDQVVRLSQQYLASGDAVGKIALSKKIDAASGEW